MTETGARKGITLEALKARRDESLAVATAHGASNLRVFGSVASGDTDPSSDVDFLIDLRTDAVGFAYFGVREALRAELADLLGCEVDVVELRGPFSPRGERMAHRIQENAIPL